MSDSNLQAGRARLVRLLHLRRLSWDPDIGKFRSNEGTTADAIEKCFNDPLERVEGGGDWRGTRTGRIYDDCSPPPTQFFDVQFDKWRASLISHATAKVGVNIVTVDLRFRNLNPEQIDRIAAAAAALPRTARKKVWLLLNDEG